MRDYVVAEKLNSVSPAAGGRPAYFLAGGTDLMVMKKENLIDGRRWIDISNLDELKTIEIKGEYLHIGALVTMSELAYSEKVREYALALSLAASKMGSPLIRNLATIGGNFANSSPSGDTIPALCALDADLVLSGGGETRNVPGDEFCISPGENVLNPGEIITGVKVPLYENISSGFIKLGSRAALAISKVSLAVGLILNGKRIDKIRIAMGGVGPKVLRAKRTEILLRGEKITDDILVRASQTIIYECSPVDDFRSSGEYRCKMTAVLLKRLLDRVV